MTDMSLIGGFRFSVSATRDGGARGAGLCNQCTTAANCCELSVI